MIKIESLGSKVGQRFVNKYVKNSFGCLKAMLLSEISGDHNVMNDSRNLEEF